MPSHRVCYGVPGAGKTTFGVMLAREWFTRGARPDSVAYLGFTKAAARTAAARIANGDTYEEAYPLFRTIHSLSYMGLRQTRGKLDVVTTSHMKRFAKETGLEGSYGVAGWEDVADALMKLAGGGQTEWDRMLGAYTITRLTSRSPQELKMARRSPGPGACNLQMGYIETRVYESFVRQYEDWKAKEGLVDFTDMLEYAATQMPPLSSVSRVIVDEAQDLCPLHHLIIDRVFSGSDEVWWLGDDDQAIFSFSGASAELFLKRADQASFVVVLRKTRRYGQHVIDFSRKIIKRVTHRQEKPIVSSENGKGEILLSGFQPIHGDILVLHRHVQGCQAAARAYIDAGIPFRNERGKDPLGIAGRVKGWKVIDLLSCGEHATTASIQNMVESLFPSISKGSDEERIRLVVHGGKKKLADLSMRKGAMTLRDLVDGGILTEGGAEAIKKREYGRLKHEEDLSYYERVSKNGYALDGRGAPKIVTIHGSKGRQAKDVIVFSEMGQRCWGDPDTEHRLAYVASTRTQEGLTICTDQLVEWAGSNYNYPLEG